VDNAALICCSRENMVLATRIFDEVADELSTGIGLTDDDLESIGGVVEVIDKF